MDRPLIWSLLVLVIIAGARCEDVRDKRCDVFAGAKGFLKITVNFPPGARDDWAINTNFPHYFQNNPQRLEASADDMTPKVDRLYIASRSICNIACVTQYAAATNGAGSAEIYIEPSETMPCKLLLGSKKPLVLPEQDAASDVQQCTPTAVEKTESISIEVTKHQKKISVACCGTNALCTARAATHGLTKLISGMSASDVKNPYDGVLEKSANIQLYIHNVERGFKAREADCNEAYCGVDVPVFELPPPVIGEPPTSDIGLDGKSGEVDRKLGDGHAEDIGDKVDDQIQDGDGRGNNDKTGDDEDGQEDPNIGEKLADGYIPYRMIKAESYGFMTQVTGCSAYDGMGCAHCLSISGCSWSSSGDGKCHSWGTVMKWMPSAAQYLSATTPVTDVAECAADTKYRKDHPQYIHVADPWDDLEYIR